MRLSMILPAYNVAGYIDACLESVTQQDIPASDYEIIIVNDGSTDDTPHHIEQWAAKHRNIRVINQENQGLSAARNNGLNRQHGTMGLNKPMVNIFGSLIVTTRFVLIALVDCLVSAIVCKQICFVWGHQYRLPTNFPRILM